MLRAGSVLVDFDGTACTRDVSVELLAEFGNPSWPEYDRMVERGEIGLRQALEAQAAMLHASREEMVAYAATNCPLDPAFPDFVSWARLESLPVAIVSDGFAFHIEPMLAAAGLDGLEVIAGTMDFGGPRPRPSFPNAHPECVGCGTCKMKAVLDHRRQHGCVAFVGDGASDRYAARFADLVFAKEALIAICERDGIPFLPWETLDDVRERLLEHPGIPERAAPTRCPGWRV